MCIRDRPYTRTHTSSGMSANYGKFVRQGTGSSDGRRYPGNVLFVPTVMGGIHPTQKPVELCEYFIKTYTDEGAAVSYTHLYVNRPGLSFGYFFRGGGTLSGIQKGIVEFTVEGYNCLLYTSTPM